MPKKNRKEDVLYDPEVDYSSLKQHRYRDTPGYTFYTCPRCGR